MLENHIEDINRYTKNTKGTDSIKPKNKTTASTKSASVFIFSDSSGSVSYRFFFSVKLLIITTIINPTNNHIDMYDPTIS